MRKIEFIYKMESRTRGKYVIRLINTLDLLRLRMRIKEEAKTADAFNKPRFYDKERLTKLSQPRK